MCGPGRRTAWFKAAAVGRTIRRRRKPDAAHVTILILATAITIACGKKGPPLPPLVRVPTAPADFAAERRGGAVEVRFVVPGTNTDGTRPANIQRVDVFRLTGPSTATDAQLLKLGTRVASLPVKSPRNPDVTTEADEPAEEADLKEEGLDQGATTQFEDELDSTAFKPIDPSKGEGKSRSERQIAADSGASAPLVGPPPTVVSAVYVAVGVNNRGRRGPLSRRATVPLVPSPMPPSSPQIAYDETTIHVTWTSSASGAEPSETAPEQVLPSRILGVLIPTYGFHVYDVSPSVKADSGTLPLAGQERLTGAPVAQSRFEDKRIEWGTTRCYTVRTVETIGGLTLESDAAPPTCTTLTDTFPPAAPRDLSAVSSGGTMSLNWEPNTEKDLAGYVVLRGISGNATLERLTPTPIRQSSFSEMVQPGTRYVYAVQAVDLAGNVSPMSERKDEIAR
jgi:hypothetical protein